jgi:hypothetical protein
MARLNNNQLDDIAQSKVTNLTTDQTTQNNAIALNTAKVSFDSTSSTRLANTSGTNTGDNAGVTSVGATAPVASSGGTTPTISMPAATSVANGYATSTQITKLNGIATGATANSSDATLLARANHTGTQTASTISDFQATVSANTAVTANTAKVTNATHTGEVTGATALTIADNIVDEANLKADNAPVDDYYLAAKSAAAGGLTWKVLPGGGGSGDVVGPASATDNAIARFDAATGKLIQNSTVTIADTTGDFAGVGTVNTLTLPSSNFVGLTDSQTLTNKTLTNPRIATIDDGTGNNIVDVAVAFLGVSQIRASGTNNLRIAPGTGTSKTSFADGADLSKVLTLDNSGATTATATTLTVSQTANRVVTLPDATDTLVGRATTDTLTNKTLTTPTIASFTNATHNHTNAAGGGTLSITGATTGTLTVGRGGTGATTHTSGNYLKGAGTGAITSETPAILAAAIGALLFPIGAIYTATVATNPATLLGFGTWAAYGDGRVIVGKAAAGTFSTAGATGGAETHTLTTTEMPVHTHIQDSHTHPQRVAAAVGGGLTGITGTGNLTGNAASTQTTNVTTATNQNAGSGDAHNNLQPYIVAYVWQRTA